MINTYNVTFENEIIPNVQVLKQLLKVYNAPYIRVGSWLFVKVVR